MSNWDWIGNEKYKKWTNVCCPIHFIHEIRENIITTIITLDYKKFKEFKKKI